MDPLWLNLQNVGYRKVPLYGGIRRFQPVKPIFFHRKRYSLGALNNKYIIRMPKIGYMGLYEDIDI